MDWDTVAEALAFRRNRSTGTQQRQTEIALIVALATIVVVGVTVLLGPIVGHGLLALASL